MQETCGNNLNRDSISYNISACPMWQINIPEGTYVMIKLSCSPHFISFFLSLLFENICLHFYEFSFPPYISLRCFFIGLWSIKRNAWARLRVFGCLIAWHWLSHFTSILKGNKQTNRRGRGSKTIEIAFMAIVWHLTC